jgi:hypothetical protein
MRGSSFGDDDDDNLSLPASRHCKSKRGGRRPPTLPSQLEEAVDQNAPLLDSSSTNDNSNSNSNNNNNNQDPKARGGADRSLRPGMLRGASYEDLAQFLEELSTINEGRKALGGADRSLRPGMVRGASFKHEDNGSQTTPNSTRHSSPNKATYPMSPTKSSSVQNVMDAISGIVSPDIGYGSYHVPAPKKIVPLLPSWAKPQQQQQQQDDPAVEQQQNSQPPVGISLPNNNATNVPIIDRTATRIMDKGMAHVSRDLDMLRTLDCKFESDKNDKLTCTTKDKGKSLDQSSESSSSHHNITKVSKEDRATKEKCYMWYARLGQPNRELFKRKVAALHKSCDITVDDVDCLPWLGDGALLSVRKMNELFMGNV